MSNDRTPRRGVLLIVASPSGAGKTSLCRRLMADHGGLELSVSMTTRGIRPGEVAGRDYHFVDDAEFDRLVQADAFLEWANVHGARYGSPRAPIDRALAEGRDVLFDIDWQGAQQLFQIAGGDVVRVFILPPSMEELHERLKRRATDPEAVIDARMGRAAIAARVAAALPPLTPEQAYAGVDYGKKGEDFTIALPRFRLPGKVDELAGKVLAQVRRAPPRARAGR